MTVFIMKVFKKGKYFFALSTLEWFFTSVNPFMFFHSSYCPEGIVTF